MAAPTKYDLVGQRFGELTVLAKIGKDRHRKILWSCECDCGLIRVATTSGLTTGNVLSCTGYRTGCKYEGVPQNVQKNMGVRRPILPKDPADFSMNKEVDGVPIIKDLKKLVMNGTIYKTVGLIWSKKSHRTGDFWDDVNLHIGHYKKALDGRYMCKSKISLKGVENIRKVSNFLVEFLAEYDKVVSERSKIEKQSIQEK